MGIEETDPEHMTFIARDLHYCMQTAGRKHFPSHIQDINIYPYGSGQASWDISIYEFGHAYFFPSIRFLELMLIQKMLFLSSCRE